MKSSYAIFKNYKHQNYSILFSNQTVNPKTKGKPTSYVLFSHRHDSKRSFFELKPTVNHLKPNGIVTPNQTNLCPV